MPSSKFVLGTINQGPAHIDYEFSAYSQNTIFLSSLCESDDYLDLPANDISARGYLKNIGSLVLTISDIFSYKDRRYAELIMDNQSQEKYKKVTDFLFKDREDNFIDQNPKLMTLTPMTALKVGDKLGLGYVSVMEVLGEGNYRLKHDYPIERTQGPRYEKFKDNE